MINRVVLLLSVFFVSSSVWAGTMGALPPICNKLNVLQPCATNQWLIEAQSLYLKSLYSDNFAFSPASAGGLNNSNTDSNWGYRLTAGYRTNKGNDITVSWFDYSNKNRTAPLTGSYTQLTGTGALVVTAPYSQLLANKLSQLNVDFNQKIIFSDKVRADISTGLQYSKLRVDHTDYFNIPPVYFATTQGVSSDTSNDYSGVGPRFAMSYSYRIIPSLQIVAGASTSLLYGSSRYNMSTLYGNGLIASSIFGSKKNLVPEFEAKLGANYSHPLPQGTVNIEGGYNLMQYWGAIQAVLSGPMQLAEANFGLSGPYISMKWIGNA